MIWAGLLGMFPSLTVALPGLANLSDSHAYILYAPLLIGSATIIFEGKRASRDESFHEDG